MTGPQIVYSIIPQTALAHGVLIFISIARIVLMILMTVNDFDEERKLQKLRRC